MSNSTSTVVLHVYDLSKGMMAAMSRQFLGQHFEGIWHTGIVVYGNEYYYGQGIFSDPPGQTHFGRPDRVLQLGSTEIPEDLFDAFLEELQPRFNALSYNLFSNNCNHFTNECAKFLVGAPIPDYIISLPNDFLSTPLGAFIQPMLQQQLNNSTGHAFQPHQHHQAAQQQQPQQHQPQQQLRQPLHVHDRVPLKALNANTPATFSSAVISKMIEKLKSFIPDVSATCAVTEHDRQVLDTLQQRLQNAGYGTPSPSHVYDLPDGTFDMIEHLFATLADAQAFPLLDLLRILLLNRAVNQHYALKDMAAIDGIVKRFLFSGFSHVACTSMTLKVICNMFATAFGANVMLDASRLPVILEAVGLGLCSSHADTVQTAASVAFNCSLYVSRRDTDTLLALESPVVHCINNTTMSSNEHIAYALLMTLGKLIYKCDEAVDLANTFEVSLEPFTTNDATSDKVKEVAREVAALLQASAAAAATATTSTTPTV